MRTKNNRGRQPRSDLAVTLAFLTLLALNLFDLTATLLLVDRGAQEWNPWLRWLLDRSPYLFTLAKLTLVSIAGGFLAFQAVRRRWAWIALLTLNVTYATLTFLHLFLLRL